MTINKFVSRATHSLISEKRIYNKPKIGGPVVINVKVYASSLRMAFKTQKDDNVKMHTPQNHLRIMRINGPRIRNNGTKMGKPTKTMHPTYSTAKADVN